MGDEAVEATFAPLLADALQRRRMGLTRLRDLLLARGLPVGLSTLSYWRSGRRRPEGPASMDVVAAVEEILGLPTGHLLTALGPSRRTGPPEPFVEAARFFRHSEEVTSVLAGLGMQDCTRGYVEEYVAASVDVDARGRQTRVALRSRVRALSGGVSRVPLVVEAGVPLEEPVRLVDTWGCEARPGCVDLDRGLLVLPLLLDRPLEVGEVATYACELAIPDTLGADEEFSWSVARRVREVEVWARFDPLRMPASAVGFTTGASGADRTVPLDVSGVSTLAHHARGFGPGAVGLRWSWTSSHADQDDERDAGCTGPGTEPRGTRRVAHLPHEATRARDAPRATTYDGRLHTPADDGL